MANQSTINSLIPLVRARMNLTSMNTISDDEIKLFIQSSMAQLYETLCNRHKDYYARPYVFGIQSNSHIYPLPENFRSDVQVWARCGTVPQVRRVPMATFTWEEYSTYPVFGTTPYYTLRYRIVSNLIYLNPIPTYDAQDAIEMLYVPQWKPPPNDDATIDRQLPNGWERVIEFDTCVQIAARMRLSEYYQMYSRERDTVQASVVASASLRDEQPATMTDAYRWGAYNDGYGPGWGY